MKTPEQIFADNVRAKLNALGMTQKDLALKIGMGEQALSGIMNGRPVRRSNQELIAKALFCSRNELFGASETSKEIVDNIIAISGLAESLKERSYQVLGRINPDLLSLLVDMSENQQRRLVKEIEAERYGRSAPPEKSKKKASR